VPLLARVFVNSSRVQIAPEDIPPTVYLDDVLGALRRG
jgi:hypothetical protein